jgi:ABC transport system ATP-binding/permease protein
MSEPLLKAIIELFAIVAKEDEVTQHERDQIENFLNDHLNKAQVEKYLRLFDQFTSDPNLVGGNSEDEKNNIRQLCGRVNKEFTQQQKVIIIIDLVEIILADGSISAREEELLQEIGQSFNVSEKEIAVIRAFVVGKQPNDLNHPEILVIDGNTPVIAHDYKHLHRADIHGFVAILHLETIDAYYIKYLGQSALYLNGVPLKSGKLGVFSTGSTIRFENATTAPVYFGDVLAKFLPPHTGAKISFEAKNLSFHFKNGAIGLRNIEIAEVSGRLIGLMGASGAGKSTLLNVLNGQETPTSGKVLINGINLHKEKEKMEGVIGFVPQDDLLIEDLTVYQNLYFAAKLCFRKLSEKEVNTLVVKTLTNLGLLETRDLKVGSPLEKTISGGQRKRLNIGLELLREPSVLFVDEPTSGLSSRDSENIMDLLKELSLKGKLIFVVIHQPSSDIFKMFDKLVILDVGGYQIYYGNPVEAVVYFRKLIDMINSDQGECIQCGNVNPEQIFNIIETKVVNEYGNFTNERKILPEQWNQYFVKLRKSEAVRTSKDKPPTSLDIPSRFKQLFLFASRDIRSKLSNTQYMIINLLEAPFLAAILAYIVRYYNVEDTTHTGYIFSKNLNLPAYLFISVIVALFMGLTVSAEEIIRDRKILKREAFLNLSRSSYLSSKIFILLSLSAFQTLTFVIVGNAILGIHDMLLSHWAILFATSFMANMMGLNISSGFNSAITIYILIPILLIPQLILSGVVVKFDKLNPQLNNDATVPWVGDLMTSRWAFEAAMVTQFKDNPFEKEFYPFDRLMGNSDYMKIYYLPTLESKLDYCFNNFSSIDVEVHKKIIQNLRLLKTEITASYELLGMEIPADLSLLGPDTFNSKVYQATREKIESFRNYYVKRYNQADKFRDGMIVEKTNTPEKKAAFEARRERYQNEAIAEIVKNQAETKRIMEDEGRLVQKIFPIYMRPEPAHILDFRAQFYTPEKHLFGYYFDTLYFNLGMIFFMSLLLILTLYFDLLRRLLNWFEHLSRRFNKR